MPSISKAQLCLSRIASALTNVAITAAGVDAATASWDRNSEPDVVGYQLSYGTQSGVHTVAIDVGNVTTYQLNPPPGNRYYVVIQAYNTAGVLSAKSAEAILDVPATSGTLPATPPPSGSISAGGSPMR